MVSIRKMDFMEAWITWRITDDGRHFYRNCTSDEDSAVLKSFELNTKLTSTDFSDPLCIEREMHKDI